MTLRDELAAECAKVYDHWDGPGEHPDVLQLDFNCADAVLASPPLQAIRAALKDFCDEMTFADGYDAEWWLIHYDLPESVIAWVLEADDAPGGVLGEEQ